MFDEPMIAALARQLCALPRQELRLFALLPQLFRDGVVVEAAIVPLGPAIEAAADEAARYAEAAHAYAGSFLATLLAGGGS